MNRIIFLISLLLLSRTFMYGQLSATASVSADIIYPVGTENKGELLAGTFYPGKKEGIIELKKCESLLNEATGINNQSGNIKFPSFHITGTEFAYSITFSYEPLLINRYAENNTMRIESLSVIPSVEENSGLPSPGRFSIGAKINVGASQVPGVYSSHSTYAVTVHFN